MRVAVHNLGCKVNGYELDVMVEKLKGQGYEMVPFEDQADVYVINTCTVTNIADRKSRQMLHKAKKENPEAVVVAVGCYVETDEKRIEEDPAIDIAIGTNRKSRIAEILNEYLKERDGEAEAGDKTLGGMTLEDITDHPEFESMHLTSPGHTRAYVKIQDGCNQFCSYCIIPYARGRIRSRDPEEVMEEIRELAGQGVREVVITGIHVGSYGKEKGLDPETELISLLRRIQLIAGIERIRLGSLEPRIMTENFVRTIAGLSKVCPHFHLSLQSGCDATLKRMNRHYTAAEYMTSVEMLRRFYDRPAITTDVITGFPMESEADFEECRAFCEAVNFYEIHVFPYSVRKGTVAASMEGQLTMRQKKERSDVLLQLTRDQSRNFRQSFLGQEEEILLEEPVTIGDKTYVTGHTMRYVEGLIPLETARERLGEDFAGKLIRGRFTQFLEGTQYLLMDCEQA